MNFNRARVEKMVNGGYGLAKLGNGQALFLQNSLVGETVLFKVLHKQKRIVFGTALTILSPDSARIEPPCSYYGSCGGCNLQHTSYNNQLKIKDAIAAELFHGLDIDSSCLQPIIPSPEQFGYRQRIRLCAGSGKPGYRKFRSNEVIAVDACPIAHPAINLALADILCQQPFIKLCHIADEIELLLNPDTQKVNCLFFLHRKARPADRNYAAQLVEKSEYLERVFLTGESFSMEGPYGTQEREEISRLLVQEFDIKEEKFSYTLSWEVGGFCQVNLLQNRNLVSFVLQKSGLREKKAILDLYCGMGNFSIPLAHNAGHLVGVEGQGAAIRSAKNNSEKAGFGNTEFIKGSIQSICTRLTKEKNIFDITVIDPPRQGIPGLAEQLTSLTRRKLIYISCDPATLARDLRELTTLGFTISLIQPFDMFPQTHHIETVAVLEKN